MKRHLILFFLFTSTIAFSQRAVINDSSILKKGIYQSFEEFKYNSPSIECDLKVEKGRIEYARGIGNYNHHQFYQLVIDSTSKRKIKGIFGYCDGKSIFIRNQGKPESYRFPILNVKHIEKEEYNKIELLGVYSCFEDAVKIDFPPMYTPMLGMSFASGEQLYNLVLVAIDINSGEVFQLTNENMKLILKNDSVLYKEFISNSKSSLLPIVKKYNEKHRYDGIYKTNQEMTIEQANLFIKKHDSDTLVNLYLTRVLDGLKKNNAFLKTGIYQERYKNGNIRKLGILTDHHFRQNDDQTLFKVGVWYNCYEDGSLKEEIEYDIFEKKIKSTKYNRNGDVVK